MNTAARNHPRKEPSLNNSTKMLPNFPWLIVGRETDFGYCCLNSFYFTHLALVIQTELSPTRKTFEELPTGEQFPNALTDH